MQIHLVDKVTTMCDNNKHIYHILKENKHSHYIYMYSSFGPTSLHGLRWTRFLYGFFINILFSILVSGIQGINFNRVMYIIAMM